MKPVHAILSIMFALIAPVIFFAITLLNEKYPVLPYVVCIPLYALAGYISGKANGKPNVGQWVGWCAFVGVIASILLTVAKF